MTILDRIKNATYKATEKRNRGRTIEEALKNFENFYFDTIIKVSENTTESTYTIPDMTVEDVIKAFTLVNTGRQCVVVDAEEADMYVVNQAHIVSVTEVSVSFMYKDIMELTYTTSSEAVVITAKTL